MISEYYDLAKINISGNKKILHLVNELNIKSLRMKYSKDKNNILSMETKLQNIYNKKEFQGVLDDIEYDITELLKL